MPAARMIREALAVLSGTAEKNRERCGTWASGRCGVRKSVTFSALRTARRVRGGTARSVPGDDRWEVTRQAFRWW
ncbi:hypothetical protein GCM10010253_41660 [Streptomyces badius]|uniref:Trp operon leader peptide n=1 Tax=Streptomyces badius TaxID=1941 RepID=A0ABQ2TD00_STRBA|nr:hypothetical protein GCM10010253_41660 [Streptomyces badius]